MLADELDFVIGVDPHRDSHALGVVEVRSGAVVFESNVDANSGGYVEALRLAQEHARGRRAFAVEGAGSFGAGLARFLQGRGEHVLEVGRLPRERRLGGKTDALDAIRAARSVLSNSKAASPRSTGEREALRALMTAREGAVTAKRAALCQLRGMLITTPEPLRSELRPLTRGRLLARGRNPSRAPARRRTARNLASPPGCCPAHTTADRRGTQTRARDRETRAHARTSASRPARSRAAQCGPGRALLVTPRTAHKRGRVRTPRRCRSDPRLLRPNDPLPPRPRRGQETQPSTPPDPRNPAPNPHSDDRLHRAENPRGQDPPRGQPLPQALPRPQPLPTPRTPATTDLTNIEASNRPP
jgi:transposase